MSNRFCVVVAFAVASFAATALAHASIVFHGGAGMVGGSCAIVERDGTRLLVDCGSACDADGADGVGRGPDVSFGYDPKAITAVVLTHAHQDHSGRVPELFHAGFCGTVYATEPTIEILRTTFKSQVQYDMTTKRVWRWSKRSKRGGTVHWHPACQWNSQISKENLRTFNGSFAELSESLRKKGGAHAGRIACCRTCAGLELDALMAHFRPVAFGARTQVGPFALTLQSVLHLPGAASVRIEDSDKSYLFSGDMGTFRSCLGGRPAPASKADFVFVESTYGSGRGTSPEATKREYARFRETVGDAVRKGGIAWVPAFALDRSQRVLLEVARGMRDGTIPADAPVWMTSPTAREITASYVAHPDWFAAGALTGLDDLFKRVRGRFNPKKDRAKGGIVVSTSGMLDTAASKALIPDLLPDAGVTLCLVGYQAPGTPGHALLHGAKEIMLEEAAGLRTVPVRARIAPKFDCFSGHGDAAEIDDWLANNRDSHVFLIHGDPEYLKARHDDLAAHHAGPVEVVEKGKVYQFPPASK